MLLEVAFSNQRECKGDASEQAILKCVETIDGNVMMYRKNYPTVTEIPFNSTNKFQVQDNASCHNASYNVTIK